jgi:hypothetical protein
LQRGGPMAAVTGPARTAANEEARRREEAQRAEDERRARINRQIEADREAAERAARQAKDDEAARLAADQRRKADAQARAEAETQAAAEAAARRETEAKLASERQARRDEEARQAAERARQADCERAKSEAIRAKQMNDTPEWSAVKITLGVKACYWNNGPTRDCIDLVEGEEAITYGGRTKTEVCVRPVRLEAGMCYWAKWTAVGDVLRAAPEEQELVRKKEHYETIRKQLDKLYSDWAYVSSHAEFFQ